MRHVEKGSPSCLAPRAPCLFYATRDGHTKRIASRLAERMSAHGRRITPQNLANQFPDFGKIESGAIVVIIAAIRYGFHLPEARRFMAAWRKNKMTNPLVVISVNLTARKANKNTPETNPYLRRWLKRSRVKPVFAAAVAGYLDYPRYNWFDRTIIRLIMTITRGPTDPRVAVEFTDWGKVNELGDQLARLQVVDFSVKV